MALVDSLIVFVVSLVIGAVGIYVGARVLTDREDFSYAFVTALIGAVVWTVVAFLIGWIPFLGPLLAFLAYLLVLNARYPGGILTAAGIALVAMVASLVVLYILAVLNVTAFEAAGVPGV
jgi:hypothetical protein